MTQGSNPNLLHWQVESLLLNHQGSPFVTLKVYSTFVGECWACCLFLSLPYFSRGCQITLSGESAQCSQSPLSSTSVQNLSPLGSSLAAQWLGLHASTAGGTGWLPGQGTNIPHDARCGKKKNTQKNLLPLPTSSLAAGHYILLVAFLLLLLSLLKCLSNALFPRHSFGHHVSMTFLSNLLLEGALRCL